ncbi:nucleolar complex protein 2 homolog [Amphibalanus amphitrite]|uniref:nucleolar complex protein 2 homolog n=1 Tax=Amphibalanus amphitrite TaxID=1232801 RepID=UPI001C904F7F|nr:nucleolar complex protein 2 homolog [Amphibalanus amphitrite]XP_043195335.1 nucleolar complex protein 2 homolog [Amphibalanus amphitrite]XP_043195337.1 nucleolar complex protein 2 homolog [Amphibalanus amphitrite]XP_043195338.1 nucleolar complex protein 2 homolog [Amphibalanus amphitrite]XP_043195339.1 nucleolar complex protein 2 homolog [Amphibalanus amphitrite]XP_043195340.1 nucleolar complex protein 2 homolog [Amphibalanus amphitrite]XP_043195341.1 nucleolar complex protein 2 homolog [A
MKAKKVKSQNSSNAKQGTASKSKKNGVSSDDKDAALASMSIDQFLASGFDSDDDGDAESDTPMNGGDHETESAEEPDDSSGEEEEESSEEEGNEEDFHKSLDKLKDTDPEFYKFLQENDKDVFEGEEEKETEQPEPADEDSAEDSDDEPSDPSGLSLTQISRWEAALASTQAKSALKEVTAAFRSAVQRATGGGAEGASTIDDPTVFNSLVRLCLNEVPRAVASILKLESSEKDPSRCKRWPQVKGPVKRFLTDVIQLLASSGSAAMQRALLRHLLAMTPYLATEQRLCSQLVSRLVALWSAGEEEVRVLAFVNLYRLTRRNQAALLDTVLMKAYLAYVKNCAFTSAQSWPHIHLMRRSLVELYSIDPSMSYQRAFLYIRQLAIHLRNAKLDKKKFQVVYNWQYVHCLLLWSALIGEDRSEELRLLLYPLTQIMLGTVNLITTSRHYPLRLHVVRALTQLSAATNTFIPVLPLLLQVLHQTDFNKRSSRVSMRPLDLSCMLRFSEAELKENGFRDGVFDGVLSALVEYLHVECCSLAFPELVVLARIQLKEFLSKCKVRTYNQQMKEVLDKIKANAEHLDARRQTLPFELSDLEAVRRWEQERRTEGTPFTAFYELWRARQEKKSSAKPGKDSKISVRAGPDAVDSVDEDEENSEDEVRPFDEDAEDDSEGEQEDGEMVLRLESESDEVEDEGDKLEPLKPSKNKQKKQQKSQKRKRPQQTKAGAKKAKVR